MFKKNYKSPKIETIMIELEEGVAAGSATVFSKDANNEIMQEWQKDETDYRVVEW